jgi:hypothetical protein
MEVSCTQSIQTNRQIQFHLYLSVFICVHLCTLREGEAPTSVVPNPKLGLRARSPSIIDGSDRAYLRAILNAAIPLPL